MEVLTWEKPPRAELYEQWAACQADDAPPGTYMPNMDEAWKLKWKAKMLGQRSPGLSKLRVEIRKSVRTGPGSIVQVLIVVTGGTSHVLMSMNGTASFTHQEWLEMGIAVSEAREAMLTWRREHQAAVT